MGNSASKAARTLPKTPSAARAAPPWAGARTPGPTDVGPGPNAVQPGPQRHPVARASELKDEDIERDASDPQLLANLRELGQVKVDHRMETERTHAAVQKAFESRARAEADAAGATTPRNRLWGYALATLLEQRLSVKSDQELSNLANKFNMDGAVLARLAKTVNVPSIKEGSERREVDSQGNASETVVAEWREPVLDSADGAARIAS
ncbi:unnamed protein product [Peniophora sp. CBMAI 1063]|nr:unnamed protein product [Peniophora sp. CBMAI 1063]